MRYKLFLLMTLSMSLGFSGEDFEQTIRSWMDKFNVVATHNRPDAFKSQLGFHLVGGQGIVRPIVDDFNPIHIDFPKFSAGCGGINYATGGIHIANGTEMVDALKQIATGGVCYAFNLGLQVVSPQIAAATKDIQHFANQLNSININSCEVSKSIVQALMPNIDRSSQVICSEAAVTNSVVDGYIRAKHKCSRGDFEDQMLGEVKKENPDWVLGEYNVAWEAMKKTGIDDHLTRLLFLNITGSIVVSKEKRGKTDIQRKIALYPSKIKDSLDGILFGGVIPKAYQLHRGSDGKYDELNIDLQDLHISHSNCWKTKIYKQLRSLADKFDNESMGSRAEALSDEDKKLLNSTKLPIGSMMTLMSQWSGSAMDLASLNDCAEIIACERLCEFIGTLLGHIRSASSTLEVLHTDGSLEEYVKSLDRVEKMIRDYERRNLLKFQNKQDQIEFLMNFERNLREKSRGL